MNDLIVVLDDDAAIRRLVQEALTSEGHEVLTLATEDELNLLMRDRRIDLFILDIILPASNGLNIAQRIRRESNVGIILLTGQANEVDTVLGLEIGADDYITKPFRVRELRARVRSVLRRSGCRPADTMTKNEEPVQETATYELGGWRVDIERRTVHSPNEVSVDLSGSEFDVFVSLLAAEGKVLSREALVDVIRGKGWSTNERLIDGVVSRLRKRLSQTGNAPPIRTVRGVGYAAIA